MEGRMKRLLRGTSFLFTYNDLFFSLFFKDGTPPFASLDGLWAAWRLWEEERKEALGIVRSTSTVERSLNSPDADRVHIHWKVDLKEPIDWRTKDSVAFHGVVPNHRTTVAHGIKAARGTSFRAASDRGHFYTWANKLGTCRVATNYEPWIDYKVFGKWPEDLWLSWL